MRTCVVKAWSQKRLDMSPARAVSCVPRAAPIMKVAGGLAGLMPCGLFFTAADNLVVNQRLLVIISD
jgi:hypothetical protein